MRRRASRGAGHSAAPFERVASALNSGSRAVATAASRAGGCAAGGGGLRGEVAPRGRPDRLADLSRGRARSGAGRAVARPWRRPGFACGGVACHLATPRPRREARVGAAWVVVVTRRAWRPPTPAAGRGTRPCRHGAANAKLRPSSACSRGASAAPEQCAAATSGRIQSGGAPSSMGTRSSSSRDLCVCASSVRSTTSPPAETPRMSGKRASCTWAVVMGTAWMLRWSMARCECRASAEGAWARRASRRSASKAVRRAAAINHRSDKDGSQTCRAWRTPRSGGGRSPTA